MRHGEVTKKVLIEAAGVENGDCEQKTEVVY